MLFTSYGFIGFLIILFALYYLLPKKLQWPLLLLADYVFYWFAGPGFLLYILSTTVTVYLSAMGIAVLADRQKEYLTLRKAELSREERRDYKAGVKKKQQLCMLAGLLVNLAVLAAVKYTNFAIANINALLSLFGGGPLSFLDIALPLGISFYTFQALGYLIDVYRGTAEAERSPFKFALFVSFFPQLIQGPISRFNDLKDGLFSEHSFDSAVFSRGLQRVLWGYFKKLVIADRILTGVNAIIGSPELYNGGFAFVGMLFYALELYADFTGGIDITIGIAEALGIPVKENFIRPFFSKSVKEYWRRWHITMGTWFTDYIFYPISVCKPMLRFSKFARAHFGNTIGKRLPVYLSSFAVWLATGVWHGAGWNFVAWGLGNWVIIMVSQELEPLYERFHQRFHVSGKTWFRAFQVIRTVFLMSALRMFDCYRNVPLTFRMFFSIFSGRGWAEVFNGGLMGLGLSGLDYGILAFGLVLLLTVSLIQRSGSVRDKLARKPYPLRFAVWFGLFIIVLLAGEYGIGYDQSQFIYNQF